MEKQRLNVNIGPETVATLRSLDEETGQSFTETVRRAIKLFGYIRKMEKDGWSFEMKKRGETPRVVTIL